MENAAAPLVDVSSENGGVVVTLGGDVTVRHVTALEKKLSGVDVTAPVRLDLSDVSRFDTATAWAIASLQERLEEAGQRLEMTGASDGAKSLLASVIKAMPEPLEDTAKPMSFADWVASIGESVFNGFKFLAALISYFGLFLARLVRSIRHPKPWPCHGGRVHIRRYPHR